MSSRPQYRIHLISLAAALAVASALIVKHFYAPVTLVHGPTPPSYDDWFIATCYGWPFPCVVRTDYIDW